MDNTVIASVIGAIGLILVGLFSYFGSKKVNRANMNAVDVETLRKLVLDVESQHKQIIDLQNEIEKIKDLLKKMEDKTRIMWQYIYALIEFIRKHVLTPPMPPDELKSDPKLMELLK